eukprot:CAMPEP_0198251382 /NCGR_PEP_ID=MMETSP1447-20131203/2230_1 /TAXON_ID=420782 /ORGANISM="Chaetoceros dichaeta, Strain CCMP1751" /LENGTH=334 /DNA_ID=CAMNT_0043936379 /DNA_START=355 /DNA_END=1359 /DNA_ORIENTATION=-
MFLKGKDKKEVDVDSKSESTTKKDLQDNYLSSTLERFNDGLPWEKKNSKREKNYMGDLSDMLNEPSTEDDATPSNIDLLNAEESELSLGQVVGIGATIALIGLPIALQSMGVSVNPSEIALNVQNFFDDPAAALQAVSESVKSMGPLGALYFGAIYTVAEVLAIPAIPLTASAGYLFGVTEGTAIVLLSASIAASIGFLLGRTFLRSYVEKILDDKPEFKRIDRAIGKEGFKVILLLRLSPLFPFSLSNYLYGVTSVKFWPYFFGTMLGFAPGTLAYVYTGEIGKALTLESGTAEPWYIYAGGLVLFSGVLKIVADVATGIIESLEEEDDELYN